MPNVHVELTREEIELALTAVRARLVELERALQNVEEGEGMDSTKFNARRMLEPQIEAHTDLVLKLEGGAKEARR